MTRQESKPNQANTQPFFIPQKKKKGHTISLDNRNSARGHAARLFLRLVALLADARTQHAAVSVLLHPLLLPISVKTKSHNPSTVLP